MTRARAFARVFARVGVPTLSVAVFLSQRIVVMARPGRIVDEIAVAEPYPRTAAFRTTPRFTAWCAQVSDALQRASADPGAPA